MRFCVNGNQPPKILKTVDEIKIKYKDRNIILDWIKDYPEADFLIDCFQIETIDWEEILKYNELSNDRVILILKTYEDMEIADQLGIRHYLGWAIQSFYELRGILQFNPCYIIPASELFFRMEDLREFGVDIRVIPNVCYNDGLPRESGVHGTWILPNHLHTIYGDYVDAVEFGDCETDKNREATLLKIYRDDKEWRTNLNILLTNLNFDNAVGRLILDEIAEVRLNCAHNCQRTGRCKICERSFSLADPDLLEKYIDKTV